MRCLVTGGAGFIGSNIVDRLIKDGNDVVVIDNESTDCHESFHWNSLAENYIWDVNDYDSVLQATENVDVVFHLAAEARIQPAIQNPIQTIKTNVLGTGNVLQASRENGVKRIIYSSTSAAYGLKNDPPTKEDMVPDCLNAYSITKVTGENLFKMYYEMYGLETIIFRYFNVYGERQPTKGQYAPVVGLFQKQYENGEPLTIIGDGHQRRDFTYIDDVVEANIKAMETENSNIFGEILNIGTGINYNIHDLVEIIANKDASVKYLEERPAEIRVSMADTSKAKELLNWESKTTLEEWIKLCKKQSV